MAVPPRESYVVAMYHDENGNHAFDRTLIGMPAEGYGFTRDPATLFGIPSHESVAFQAGPGDTILEVNLRYP